MKHQNLHQQAIYYRKQGYSYNMITKKIGTPKSTLSNWLKQIPYKPNNEVIARIGKATLKSAKTKNIQKVHSILKAKKNAKKEIKKITKRDLWMLGLGLYLGEGSKLYENIRIINSDPNIIKIAIKWFEEICGLDTKNFSLALHIYPDTNEKKSIAYWSKITGVPQKQFEKVQIDKRVDKKLKKKNKLPYGTIHLTIRSRGEKKFGVLLHRKIMGWIDYVYKQL